MYTMPESGQKMMRNHVLVIDDDVELCDLLTDYLSREGFILKSVHDGEQGRYETLAANYDLIVLDVMLPGIDGFEVLRKIREHSTVPVLMLSARGDEVDRIVGLEMGADDYLAKPFNPRELLARLKAIQRRLHELPVTDTSSDTQNNVIILGDLIVDASTMQVYLEGRRIPFTVAEFSLLRELLLTPGQVVEREELALKVLGRDLSLFDRSIDVHIASIRKKLGRMVNDVERIKTIRGVGYMYAHHTLPADTSTSMGGC
jgi:two-component system response regulator CpxR